MRLAYRFGIVFLVVVLVAGSVLVVTFDAHRTEVDESTETLVTDRTNLSASVLDERLREQRRTVAVAATNPDLAEHETGRQDRELEEFVSASVFDGATVVDETGTVQSFTTTRPVRETDPIVGMDLSEQTYVEAALDGEQYITDPFRAQTGNTIVVISAPLVDDGEVVGSVNGAYYLDETSLFNSLAGNDDRDAITVEADNRTLYTTADQFDETVSHSETLEVVDWTVTAHRDQDAVDARINRLVLFQAVSAVALLGSIVVFGAWVYTSELRHIGRLVDRVRALERREYDDGPSLAGAPEWQRIDNALERLSIALARREQMLLVLNRILRHNLRNTLNVVSGHAADLEAALEGNEQASAREIRLATAELLELADRARMTENVLDPVGEPGPRTDLAAVVRDRVAECIATREDDETSPKITVTAPAQAVAACGPEIEAAIDELLANAVDHAGPEPTVGITVETTADRVRVRVEDDGPGIPADEAAIVTGNRAISQVTHTGGIGLWLVDWIVSRYGGRLSIPSVGSGDADTVERNGAEGIDSDGSDRTGATAVFELPRADPAATETDSSGDSGLDTDG